MFKSYVPKAKPTKPHADPWLAAVFDRCEKALRTCEHHSLGRSTSLLVFETGRAKVLGEGSFGSVQKCRYKAIASPRRACLCIRQSCKDTGQWRAVKTINKKRVKNVERWGVVGLAGGFRAYISRFLCPTKFVPRFTEEMAIMKLLDHPNIVRLHEACWRPCLHNGTLSYTRG